jgi:pyruvate dehydrogenase E2 component (dihydrolipoamide acetyltransferase)
VAKQVFIPKLGQTMEQATLVRWLVVDGAMVDEGQGILEVETDKAVFTVEANARGHLHLGPYKAGEIVPVLTVVAVIGKPEDVFMSDVSAIELPATGDQEISGEMPAPHDVKKHQSEAQAGKIFASPRARKLADAKGVDLEQVTPTGYGGERVAERDVVAFVARLPKTTPVAQKMAAQTGVDLRTICTGQPDVAHRFGHKSGKRMLVLPGVPNMAQRLPSRTLCNTPLTSTILGDFCYRLRASTLEKPSQKASQLRPTA